MRLRFLLASSASLLALVGLQACSESAGDAVEVGGADAGTADGRTTEGDRDGGGTTNTTSNVTKDAATGPDAEAEPSGPPAVRYVGRFDTRDPGGTRIGWPGTRVQARFSGTSLTANITENAVFRGPSEYDVLIDGKPEPKRFIPDDGTKDYVLATGLAAGTHVVELWRRTEALVGITQFKTFTVGGGELLAPPVPKTRRIEFVGDSASNGYGVECTSPTQTFSGATQNEHKSYTALVATALSAEHSNISFSGKGVSRNYDTTDEDFMASIYLRTLAEDDSSTWGFAAWIPDVVFISLGTNDFADTDGRPAPDLANFKTKFHELVTVIRAKNPNAQILCVVSATVTDDYPTGFKAYTNEKSILQAVVAERKAAPFNDAKVQYYEMPRADSSGADGAPDLTGCDGHPNVALHQKVAADVTAKLKTLMNW